MVWLSWVSLNILIEKNGQVGVTSARRGEMSELDQVVWICSLCLHENVFLFFYLIQLKNNIRSTKHILYGQQRTSPVINFLCFGVKCKKILLNFGRLECLKNFLLNRNHLRLIRKNTICCRKYFMPSKNCVNIYKLKKVFKLPK